MEESLKYSSEMPTSVRTYLNFHLMLIKATIDVRVLNHFKFNFMGLRHGQGIERRHLACHVVEYL
jgi:hypothetical protein